jgi:hypothetical protein
MRDQHLGHHGQEAHRRHAGQQRRARRRACHGEKRQHRQQGLADHQPPAIQEIAERHDQQQAEAVADLGDRDDAPDGGVADPESVRHRVEERLGVVDIGDGEAAGEREEQRHGRRQSGGRGAIRKVHRLGARFARVVIFPRAGATL